MTEGHALLNRRQENEQRIRAPRAMNAPDIGEWPEIWELHLTEDLARTLAEVADALLRGDDLPAGWAFVMERVSEQIRLDLEEPNA